ncbi:hypothetical protein LOAG_13455 [Loa loa]|uniref:Uncharacterized protein n=1 Tax=Loa loa TaxID=7209 RepID=A0A1S0TJA0_LOALO|nr:hypothetical protein LOAG_13455 [Loa loa]EFO15062.1 hypothetical protein LOAG_13455 [Loa loa]
MDSKQISKVSGKKCEIKFNKKEKKPYNVSNNSKQISKLNGEACKTNTYGQRERNNKLITRNMKCSKIQKYNENTNSITYTMQYKNTKHNETQKYNKYNI